MDQALRFFVRQRAGNLCEYCRLPQSASHFTPFHIEHIVARQHGGQTAEDNLALACAFCNLHKGPNIAALDPITGSLVRLFHPRRDSWLDHFNWQGIIVVGITPIGSATAELLAMNDADRLEIREYLLSLGDSFNS